MKTLAILSGIFLSLSLFGQVESWNIIDRELPVNESFDKGTKVVVVINYENNTDVEYINESDETVNVIFHVSDKGTPLPDERIGPVKYRTKILEPGESVQMTFAWEKSHEISFEISGGKLRLRAGPEKRNL